MPGKSAAVIGGSPMGRWIAAPESEDYQETYGAMLRDFFGPNARLRGDLPAPTVAIIQQSLQRTPTPETRLKLLYNPHLFEAVTIENMLGQYRVLLEQLAGSADVPLAELGMLSADARERASTEWNDTKTSYPRDASIGALFEAQAAETPEATAIDWVMLFSRRV